MLHAVVIAQATDRYGVTAEISSNIPFELEITTRLISDQSYSKIVGDLPHFKLSNQVERAYREGEIDTFFVRNILDQNSWLTREARLFGVYDKIALWIDLSEYQELNESGLLNELSERLHKNLLIESTNKSINPELGILEILERYVGEFPKIDGDEIVDVFYLDIRDRFETTGQYVAGFFDPVNLTDYEFSNQREMVYMDLYPTLIEENSFNFSRSISTLVHELQHLIHAGYEGEVPELVFVNEGFSEAVEILCGFEPRDASAYLNNSNKSLLSWDYANPISDYSRASLWTHYLVEQFGNTVLSELIQNPNIGLTGYEEIIENRYGISFEEVYINWGIANIVNDNSISSEYGYVHSDRKNIRLNPSGISYQLPNVISGDMEQLSQTVFEFPFANALAFDFGSIHDEHLIVHAITKNQERGFQEINKVKSKLSFSETPRDELESVSILITNPVVPLDSLRSSVNLKVDGKKNGSVNTIQFGDGQNDTFYSNASYLSLSTENEELALIIPNPERDYWLSEISLSTVYKSELVGSDVLISDERDFLLSIYTIKNGAPDSYLLDNQRLISTRESGKLVIETFNLDQFFDQLSSISDSIAIAIKNDSDDDNYISVGLDFSDTNNGMYFLENEWVNFFNLEINGNLLAGFTPNISVKIVEKGSSIQSLQMIETIEYDYSKVTISVEPPISHDSSSVNLISELPDGTFQKFLPVDNVYGSYLFEVPVQVDGRYSFTAYAKDQASSDIFQEEQEWVIDLPSGFSIQQNYPNPFNPSTTIPFTILEQATIGWEVFDVLGRNVKSIQPQTFESGEFTFDLRLNEFASGIYFVRAIIHRDRTGVVLSKPLKVLMIK